MVSSFVICNFSLVASEKQKKFMTQKGSNRFEGLDIEGKDPLKPEREHHQQKLVITAAMVVAGTAFKHPHDTSLIVKQPKGSSTTSVDKNESNKPFRAGLVVLQKRSNITSS